MVDDLPRVVPLTDEYGNQLGCPICEHSPLQKMYESTQALDNEYIPICEFNSCDLSHKHFSSMSLYAKNPDFKGHNFEAYRNWMNRTIERVYQAQTYCSTDPNSALTKYRQISEDTMQLLVLFFTDDSKIRPNPNSKTVNGWWERLKNHAKQNKLKIEFEPHQNQIEAFVQSCNKLNQGAHNWNQDAKTEDASIARGELVNFLKYLLDFIILPPYRKPHKLTYDKGPFTLHFCKDNNCLTPLIKLNLTNAFRDNIPNLPYNQQHEKFVFVCISCNMSYEDYHCNKEAEIFCSCGGPLTGPDVLLHYHCEECFSNSFSLEYSNNQSHKENGWYWLTSDPIMRKIRGAKILAEGVSFPDEDLPLKQLMEQFQAINWIGYSNMKSILNGDS